MKCDELKTVCYIDANSTMPVYGAKEVDAAIAELKRENERLVKCCKEYDSRQRIDERIKFNGAQQLRATKRALWIARSRRAFAEARYNNQIARRYEERNEKTIAECYDKEVAKWKNSDRKCRAKAKEYE